jgi:transposase
MLGVEMRKSRLCEGKQRKLVEFFVSGSTARTTAAMVGVNKTTASYYFRRLRELIFQETEKLAQEYFEGEIEVDESYFGAVRKGKRGRGAAGKVAVFGLLKRRGKVFAKIVENAKTLIDAVVKSKPTAVKGNYLKKMTLSSTMGVGVSFVLE